MLFKKTKMQVTKVVKNSTRSIWIAGITIAVHIIPFCFFIFGLCYSGNIVVALYCLCLLSPEWSIW